jgi:hypothetical protein
MFWFFPIPGNIIYSRQGNLKKCIASLANFAPMPILACIVRHLALFCCADCADIGCAGIIATVTVFLLQLQENQQLISK